MISLGELMLLFFGALLLCKFFFVKFLLLQSMVPAVVAEMHKIVFHHHRVAVVAAAVAVVVMVVAKRKKNIFCILLHILEKLELCCLRIIFIFIDTYTRFCSNGRDDDIKKSSLCFFFLFLEFVASRSLSWWLVVSAFLSIPKRSSRWVVYMLCTNTLDV